MRYRRYWGSDEVDRRLKARPTNGATADDTAQWKEEVYDAVLNYTPKQYKWQKETVND